MHPCCDTPTEPIAFKATLTVALAGNPNSGKTTIFNALTGLRQKVANYPGVTVEKKTGRCKLPDGRRANVIDLPGTYSLISRSPDEQVAMEVLRGLRGDTPAPDVVVVVVDASNLQRNLYLVSQLIELGRPMVVALNMMDIAERRGLRISPQKLADELGVPVTPVVGHKRRGVAELKAAILNAAVAPLPDWPLPQAMKEEVVLVGGGLAILQDREGSPSRPDSNGADDLPRCKVLAERLLIGDVAADISMLAVQAPVSTLLNSAATRLSALGIDPMQADIEAHYHWIDNVVAGALVPACEALDHLAPLRPLPEGRAPAARSNVLAYAPAKTLTQKADAILVHKFWGLLIFAAIMAGLFVTIFWLADPIMSAIDTGTKALGTWVTSKMFDGPIKDLVKDGIFAGVGAVVVFVPQIALLFLFLSIMEDSGYLARAAFLMDRLLSKVGLHGKSFIPLLSSFACAIPGIMATRTIENRKDRLATIFVAPFMSCSARLPVYALLIGAFFSGYGALVKGGILLSLYVLGVVAAAGTAWIFKRSFLKGPATTFILELPTYKVPQPRQVIRQVWTNTSQFLIKAGTAIFLLSILLWAMTYYPRLPQLRASAVATQARAGVQQPFNDYVLNDEGLALLHADINAEKEAKESAAEKAVASEQLRYSIAGRLGHVLEPVIRPLGFDWKMGVGLVGAFAAREVFVSTMGIVYSVGDPGDETTDLETAMHADTRPDGSPVWTPLVAVSLLVWFVLAMQCMSTLAVVRRETGSWKWSVAMLLYMNALAYVACLAVYQVGKLLA